MTEWTTSGMYKLEPNQGFVPGLERRLKNMGLARDRRDHPDLPLESCRPPGRRLRQGPSIAKAATAKRATPKANALAGRTPTCRGTYKLDKGLLLPK